MENGGNNGDDNNKLKEDLSADINTDLNSASDNNDDLMSDSIGTEPLKKKDVKKDKPLVKVLKILAAIIYLASFIIIFLLIITGGGITHIIPFILCLAVSVAVFMEEFMFLLSGRRHKLLQLAEKSGKLVVVIITHIITVLISFGLITAAYYINTT